MKERRHQIAQQTDDQPTHVCVGRGRGGEGKRWGGEEVGRGRGREGKSSEGADETMQIQPLMVRY